MVDNFKQIRELLSFNEYGECYYLQLLKRSSDDPLIDGEQDPTYHGRMHNRSLKDYFINSLKYYDEIESEVKEMCETFNVRAYIRLNKRSYKKMTLGMLEKITKQIVNGDSYTSPHRLISSVAGKSLIKSNKTYLVDLDKEFLHLKDQVMKCIAEDCPPYSKEPVAVIKTKSGEHLIYKAFDVLSFKVKFPKIDIHEDNPTILYCK